LAAREQRPAILVATYFGDPGPALDALLDTDIEGVAVDLVSGEIPGGSSKLAGKLLVAGVVDGRNVWRTDPDRALAQLATVTGLAGAVAVSTSCSLLHVPYSLAAEAALDPQLRSWLAFADEKVAEVVLLSRAIHQTAAADAPELQQARDAITDRRTADRIHRPRVQARLQSLREDAFSRGDEGHRRMVQATRYDLPLLPTTTIGSFPQTKQVRTARADLRTGAIDQRTYNARMQAEIADVIALQEDIGFDVLVHGEPERNDMVQYFAEQLDGFATTDNGWVQSYGSRCVRPPILFGDVQRPNPITVTWSTYAQSLTNKPVKGMLTGPVTILAWSFVRDDQPLADTALQVALAIRDETIDLQNAGIGIIQIDEPALRELLPPRHADRESYLRWAVRAFRLATSGVSAATAIHTHLCYSEFGNVIGAIADLGADVTSVEAARSHMEILDDLAGVGYSRGIGPGVYDIHSPRIPNEDEITQALNQALAAVDRNRLWVNPDCGLKTRRPEEATPALRNMVNAAHAVRQQR
jgi:5-methyltetrahydropteroyltriglutamate--homocysteine methyltransferase